MKYLFIELKVRDGERVYTLRVLHTTCAKNINFVAERYASSFFSGKSTREDDFWWFNYEVTARVQFVTELTEKEYKIMSDIFDHRIDRPKI